LETEGVNAQKIAELEKENSELKTSNSGLVKELTDVKAFNITLLVLLACSIMRMASIPS